MRDVADMTRMSNMTHVAAVESAESATAMEAAHMAAGETAHVSATAKATAVTSAESTTTAAAGFRAGGEADDGKRSERAGQRLFPFFHLKLLKIEISHRAYRDRRRSLRGLSMLPFQSIAAECAWLAGARQAHQFVCDQMDKAAAAKGATAMGFGSGRSL